MLALEQPNERSEIVTQYGCLVLFCLTFFPCDCLCHWKLLFFNVHALFALLNAARF